MFTVTLLVFQSSLFALFLSQLATCVCEQIHVLATRFIALWIESVYAWTKNATVLNNVRVEKTKLAVVRQLY